MKPSLFVLGTFFIHCVVIGNLFSFGTMMPVLIREYNLTFTQSASVGSIQLSLFFAMGSFSIFFVNPVGPRIINLIGSGLWFGGMYLFSTGTKQTDPFIAIGFLCGVGGSLCYWSSLSYIPNWYPGEEKLNAIGVVMIGGGLGQVLVSFILPYYVSTTQWRQTYFLFSLVGGITLFCNAWLLSSFPLLSPPKTSIKKIVWSKNYAVCMIAICCFMFAYFVPFVFVISSAMSIGYTYIQACAVLGYLSISSIFGRPFSVFLSHQMGTLQAYQLTMFLSSVTCFCWLFSTTPGLLIAFACFYGFLSGGILTLTTLLSAELWGVEHNNFALASATVFMIPGAVAGSIIASQLRAQTSNLDATKIFCGVMFLVSFLLLLGVKKEKVMG